MRISKPIVFFDTETTGTDIQSDRIISIATIKLTPEGGREKKHFLINPEIPIPAGAIEIHGITDEDVKDAPTFKQIAKSLFEYMNECDLGGYNSNKFDIPLLAAEMKRCDINFPTWSPNLVDGLVIERMLNSNSLSATYKRYTGKDLEGAHGADADTEATLTVLERQLDRLLNTEGFPDTKLSPAEIDELGQRDGKRFDLAGSCIWKDEELVWTFGKNRLKPVLSDLNYLEWVCGPKANFPFETVEKLKQFKSEQNAK